MDSEVAKLQETIERLQRELAETTQEKIQAAEYGLAVLNEKQRLQTHVESLEAQLEGTRGELELTRSALEKYNRIVKRQTQVGDEEDERRAIETAQRESDYAQQILDLEYELRSAKHQLDEMRNENSNLATQNGELRDTVDRFERERVAMKGELREVRSRETRLAGEYSELEEENIQLQKQIAHLRASQVELEATRHEMARFENELVTLTGQLEETVRLKSIIERQLEETIVLLQSEREHKYALKRELDTARVSNALPSGSFMNSSLNASVSMSMINAAAFLNASTSTGKLNDSLNSCKLEESASAFSVASKPDEPGNLSNRSEPARRTSNADEVEKNYFGTLNECEPVGASGDGEKNGERESEPEAEGENSPELHDDDTASQAGTDEPAANCNANADEQSSLFAEVQRSELRRLQDVLAAAEGEKQELLARLAERERQLDAAKREALGKQQQLERLHVYCAAISSLNEMAVLQDVTEPQSALTQSTSTISLLTHSASASNLALPLSLPSSAHESADPQIERPEAPDSKERLIKQYEVRYAAALKQIASLTFELRRVEDRLNLERSGKSESQLRDELVDLHGKVATLEREARERDSLVRQRTEKALALRRNAMQFARRYFDLLNQLASLAPPLRNGDAGESVRAERERVERSAVWASDWADCEPQNEPDEPPCAVETDLLSSLRRRVETAASGDACSEREAVSTAQSEAELREQLARMREALVAKRDQVLTLRNLLKANKTAAELGVATLREKYETERANVTETVRRLREELRTLKEDAAQFASLRCMFAQRCDEYAVQLDEARTLLRAADDERSTLSGSLKLALGQKIALAQRLEALERERERTLSRRNAPRHNPGPEPSPSHERRGRYSCKPVAVYAGQSNPVPRFSSAQAHAFSHPVAPFVSNLATFNPMASPFNPNDSQSQQHFAACQPAQLQQYQPASHDFDLNASQQSLDASAYLQLIQRALAASGQPRAYSNTAQSLSNAIESQISNALANSGSSVHQVIAPTAVYPSSTVTNTPFGGGVPPSPSHFATPPSPMARANSSGSPSSFGTQGGKLSNGADRMFSARQ